MAEPGRHRAPESSGGPEGPPAEPEGRNGPSLRQIVKANPGAGSKRVGTPLGDAPLIPVTLLLIGSYLSWFAVHYWMSDTKWPTDPIKSLATGKGLPAVTKNGQAATSAALDAAFVTPSGSGTGSSTAGGTAVNASTTDANLPASGSLSHAQLEELWTSSGGDPAVKNKAAAIAQAESGGSPTVTSPNPDGGTNVGLWQLDTPGGKGAGHTIAQLQDPTTNAQVAIMGSANGSNWSAWATAVGSNPAYLSHMAAS